MTALTNQHETPSPDGNIASWLNLSHELRTPANAIHGYAELLLSGSAGPLSTEMRAGLGEIQKAAAAMAEQIDMIVQLAEKLPAGLAKEALPASDTTKQGHA